MRALAFMTIMFVVDEVEAIGTPLDFVGGLYGLAHRANFLSLRRIKLSDFFHRLNPLVVEGDYD